ncbi:MAG: SDR family oxidoreductase [Candidatus Alcyoniella australis]|nr:SDR family oxidoreductase [Candidatus Alcyoniella australis]
MRDLKGKTAVITGVGMGMGRLLALKLADEGMNIAAVDVREKELEQTAELLRQKGVKVCTEKLDITDREAVYKFRDNVHEQIGKVDLLVNNAGVVHGGMFLDVLDEKHLHTINVNLLGIFWMTKAFLPDMLESGAGHLVNVASAAGLLGVARGTSYSASKWGVIGFTEALRNELLAEKNNTVKFTIVCPSFVTTGMFDGAKPPAGTPWVTPEYMVGRIFKAIVKDKLYVLEPAAVKITPFFKAALPKKSWDRVAKRMGLTHVLDHLKGRDAQDAQK